MSVEVTLPNGSYVLVPVERVRRTVGKQNPFLESITRDFDGSSLIFQARVLIALAVATGKKVNLLYKDAEGNQTRRTVKPEYITADKQYFGGYCDRREDHRTFRFDRIQALEVAGV